MYIVRALLAGLPVACMVAAGDTGGLAEKAALAGRPSAARTEERAGSHESDMRGPGSTIPNPDREKVPTAEPASCSTADCHAAVKRFAKVHPPVDQDQCDLCHEPKARATPFEAGLRHEFQRAAGNADLCYECHDCLDEEAYVHKPVEQGLCVLCHDPHGSERASLLRVEPDRTLCQQCHRTGFLQGDHVHQPVAEGKCGECHEYHGGDHRRLLRAPFTAELYEPFDLGHYELCYGCHESSQVSEPITTTATGFRNGDVNLHFTHVNREEKGRTCNVCHRVHATARPHLITETAPFGIWQLPLNYRPTEAGGSCLPGCHRRRGYDRVDPIRNE